nr:efflux RND transporter periplasmic adaptor subunit [Clostridium aminobutyricum]
MAGKVEVGEKVDIKSTIMAKVVEMNVDIGSTVKKGDPILQLDMKDRQAQVTDARAALTQAQASLAGANADYETAKNNYERNNQLFQAGAISQLEFEQSQSKLNAAKTTKDVCQSKLTQAQNEITEADIQLDNGTIISPISGTVTAKNANVGEVVAAGAPLLTVVNPENLLVTVYVPEDIVSQIKIGEKVVIKVPEASKKVFDGEISVMDSVVDPASKTVLVKVSFNSQDTQLKPGMFAEVGIRN